MDFNLVCSDHISSILKELLNNRNINLDANSDICIIEKGYELEKGKIGIYFDISTLNVLIDYLDKVSFKSEDLKKALVGKYNNSYSVITYENILYFEGIGNEVFCITKDKKYRVKEKLYALEDTLKKEGFIRVSKGFIVNITKVNQIIPWFNNKLLLKIEGSTEEIDVTRKYVKDFKKFLGI